MNHTGAIAQMRSNFVGVNRSLNRERMRLQGFMPPWGKDCNSRNRSYKKKIKRRRRRRQVRRATLQSMRR
jgi:hypothetical protein